MIDRTNPAMCPLLIQVVPQLLPGRCGVSDHAMQLAHELKSGWGIDSAFVILNSSERCEVPYAAVYCHATELLENCLELTHGRAGVMLLHVSGYGYSPDGAPTLLADALEKVEASGRFRVAAYFHETFASGPPWKSAFWHQRRQQKALRRIIAHCGLIVTNVGRHAEWLGVESQKLNRVPITLMPVISTAGETDDPIPFAERRAALAVFGLAGTRQHAYRQLAGAGNLLGELGIQEILDVGPDCHAPAEIDGIAVQRMGLVPAEDLPAVFAQAQFGFVAHEWYCLAKSSVFAAFCAQGTIPVSAGNFPQEADGLREGVHVVTPRTVQAMRHAGWETCSRAAWKWYMGHRVRTHAERYAKWMGENQ